MTEQSIGDILNNEPAPEAPVEAPPEAETTAEATETPPETVERPRGPDGKFVAKETGVETEPVPPTELTDRLPQAEYAALRDERSKRQTAEDRERQKDTENAELRRQLAQYQQPQPQPQSAPQAESPPDRYEQPEEYDRWLVNQARESARAEAIDAFHTQRIIASVAQFSADKPDYQDAIGFYQRMASQNPGLDEQMRNAENPAKFAYDTAKLQMEIQQYGGIEGLIEARLKTREAEALQKLPGQLPQSAPPTISSDRSVGARSGPAWSGPAPLSELLK